jgi:sulfoxide reductase heme-binding subunit YedZ
VQRLGPNWKRLHRLAYPIGAVALLHYLIQVKLNVSEPVCVAGLFVWLMLWRALPEGWRRRQAVMFVAALYGGLGVVSGLLTVAIECGWYGVATRVDPWRVLAANETLAHGLRPAHWVFVVAAMVAVVTVARRLIPMGRRRPVRPAVA